MKLTTPKLEDVITEANKKGLKPFDIAKGAKVAPSTVTRYFTGNRASINTVEKIVNFINSQ